MAEFKRVNVVGYRDYASVGIQSIKDNLTARHKDALAAVRELKASRKELKAGPCFAWVL
jgi:transposase